MSKESFHTNVHFSDDSLAEAKLEQAFEYILNINNSLKPDEERKPYVIEENQGY